jgi:hypothetical protein
MRGPESPNQLFGGVQRGILSLFFLSHKHVHLDVSCLPPDVEVTVNIYQQPLRNHHQDFDV